MAAVWSPENAAPVTPTVNLDIPVDLGDPLMAPLLGSSLSPVGE